MCLDEVRYRKLLQGTVCVTRDCGTERAGHAVTNLNHVANWHLGLSIVCEYGHDLRDLHVKPPGHFFYNGIIYLHAAYERLGSLTLCDGTNNLY